MEKHDPKQRAVALKYDPLKSAAPQIVAKGQGFMAERILEGAEQADIPKYKDAALVESLFGVDLGQNIPPELYEVVASILIFVGDVDKMREYSRYGER